MWLSDWKTDHHKGESDCEILFPGGLLLSYFKLPMSLCIWLGCLFVLIRGRQGMYTDVLGGYGKWQQLVRGMTSNAKTEDALCSFVPICMCGQGWMWGWRQGLDIKMFLCISNTKKYPFPLRLLSLDQLDKRAHAGPWPWKQSWQSFMVDRFSFCVLKYWFTFRGFHPCPCLPMNTSASGWKG